MESSSGTHVREKARPEPSTRSHDEVQACRSTEVPTPLRSPETLIHHPAAAADRIDRWGPAIPSAGPRPTLHGLEHGANIM